MTSVTKEELEQAKLDPASVFHKPADVLAADIAKDDKLAILKRWELDADALLRGGDEGMMEDPSSAELVRAVQAAMEELDAL
ncbi:hypothetical protein V6C03_10335 [Methyloligella sp. 2.7D]|uniref:hypothetical protein n=1 Tax=unclassified Methyloligella TaxID=2625955 RepID=UPI00157DAD90|nr:hypothetical protein [Methyloligella sp. GL2]QKP77766.1 hypothetical protein HT051_10120 [Methyloligella sp. GL2]